MEVGGEGGRRVGGVEGASSTLAEGDGEGGEAAAEATAASMVSTASVMLSPSGDAVAEGVASSSSSEEASDSEEATISGAASSLALVPATEEASWL